MKSDDIDYGWFEETLADLRSHVERWPLLAFSARIATELEDGELELELARRAGRDIGIDADLAATSTRRVLPLIAPAPRASGRLAARRLQRGRRRRGGGAPRAQRRGSRRHPGGGGHPCAPPPARRGGRRLERHPARDRRAGGRKPRHQDGPRGTGGGPGRDRLRAQGTARENPAPRREPAAPARPPRALWLRPRAGARNRADARAPGRRHSPHAAAAFVSPRLNRDAAWDGVDLLWPHLERWWAGVLARRRD